MFYIFNVLLIHYTSNDRETCKRYENKLVYILNK